jgi:hypothetical protein
VIEQGTTVAILLFVAGLIYHAGRMSMRVQHLEEWRGELLDQLREIRATLAILARSVHPEES